MSGCKTTGSSGTFGMIVMNNDYKYSKPRPKLPFWVKAGNRVEIVNISKESAWYSDKDALIGRIGTFIFESWFGGAWFGGRFHLNDPDNFPEGSIFIYKACLKKINNLTH